MKKLSEIIIYLPLLWPFTGMLLYSDAKKAQVVLVIIAILTSFFVYGRKAIIENIKTNKLVRFLFLLTMCTLIFKSMHGYSSSVIRTFASMLFYFTFVPVTAFKRFTGKLPIFLLLSGVIVFGYGIWNTYFLDLGRSWGINPIPYTTVSASIGIASLVLLFLNPSKTVQKWLLVSFAFALNSIIFSQTRGTALALFSVGTFLIIILAFLKFEIKIHLKSVALIILVSLIANSGLISKRIDVTNSEMVNISNAHLDSSIGLRLQMWKAGFYLIQEKPLLGYGNSHQQAKQELVERGVITQDVVKFTHYHNEYINSLVSNGLVGFIMLLSILAAPFYIFKKIIEQSLPSRKLVFFRQRDFYASHMQQAVAGVFVTLGYIIASLTDVPFQHSITLNFYFILLFLTFIEYKNS